MPCARRARSSAGYIGRIEQSQPRFIAKIVGDEDPRVRRYAVTLAEPIMADASGQLESLLSKVESERDAGVLLQWSLSLGGANHPAAGKALESIASKAALDPWLAKSLALVNEQFVDSTLTGLLKAAGSSLDNAQPNTRAALEQTINSLWSRSGQSRQVQLLGTYFTGSNSDASPMSSLQVLLLSSLASADMEQLSRTRH